MHHGYITNAQMRKISDASAFVDLPAERAAYLEAVLNLLRDTALPTDRQVEKAIGDVLNEWRFEQATKNTENTKKAH